ncbi:hypothetical protein VUR80DRAFT_7553 [Thermomyces stellatus]
MHATADPGKGKERYPDLGRRAAVGGREMTFEMWTSVLAGERIPSLSRVPENIVPGRQFPGQRRREQWDLSNNLGAPVSITSIGAQRCVVLLLFIGLQTAALLTASRAGHLRGCLTLKHRLPSTVIWVGS